MTITFASGQKIFTADDLQQLVGLNAFKPSDETITNSSTLQNDDHLVVSAAANLTYAFRGLIMFTATTVADFKMDLSTPSGATWRLTAQTFNRGAAQGSQGSDARTALQGETLAIPGQGTAFSATGQWVDLQGVVTIGGTAGNVQVRWAQFNAEATNCVVYQGSWIRLWEM
jgi:hypothetical protein